MAPTVARLKGHGIAQWSVVYNKQCTDSSWKVASNSTAQNKTAMMESMAKLGFTPSEPPAAIANDGAYVKLDDDIAQVAVAVKAYITQNGSAFDAMRGGVGAAVDNVVTRTGRFMGDRSDGRRSNTESGDVLSVIESWLLWCETDGSFTKDDVQDSIRHAEKLKTEKLPCIRLSMTISKGYTYASYRYGHWMLRVCHSGAMGYV